MGEVDGIFDSGRRGFRNVALSVKNQRFLPVLPEGEPSGLCSLTRNGKIKRLKFTGQE